jgi:hypothetical protein
LGSVAGFPFGGHHLAARYAGEEVMAAKGKTKTNKKTTGTTKGAIRAGADTMRAAARETGDLIKETGKRIKRSAS